MSARAIETPSGKDAAGENFPVGSFLLARSLRPHVAAFYAFARAADDIADNPALSPQDKVARLDAFEDALLHGSRDPGLARPDRLRTSLADCGVSAIHARELLAAFRQDAVRTRYASWDDLMAYCRLSASPVGRYLLDLHGEDPAGYAASDPLCDALQVINHLQDCVADWREMDRVYLPQDWMAAAGTSDAELGLPALTPGLRTVLGRCLDGCEALMVRARRLPGRLRSRRLGAESAVIAALADRLIAALRSGDPLAGRVALSRPRMAFVATGAAIGYLVRGR